MTVDYAASESQYYEDRPVRHFMIAMVSWAVIASIGTVVLALLLVMPKLFYELGDSAQHFSFGRLYPTQVQLLVYGFLGNGFFAFTYFAIQRLERVRLSLTPLAMLHFVSWQMLIMVATVASVKLRTQSRWLSWMEQPLHVAMIAIWLLLFVPVVTSTLSQRKVRSRLAAPLWFILAVMVTVPLIHLVNNLGGVNGLIYLGVQDAMVQWWSGRGMVCYWLTVPAVAILYYLVPRVGEGSLFSHRLTVIHFWSIALLGCWGGNFQWHLTAVPEGADSLAMFAGLLLWLGCLGGAYNLWRSLPKVANKADRNVVRRLTITAVICYGIYCVDSMYMSLTSSTLTTQFTDWATANQTLAILGVSGLTLLAFSLVAMPNLSTVMVNNHHSGWLRWFAVEGVALQVIALYVAGYSQSASWNELNELGRLKYPEFVNSLGWIQPLWMIVVIGSILWLVATLLWLVVTLRTMLVAAEISIGGDLDTTNVNDPVVVPSALVGAPVLNAAVGLEQWSQLAWHAGWERSGLGMAMRTLVVLLIGTLVFWLPSFLYRGSVVAGATITQSPYTDLELLGREIYVREGCVSCHTQASRPLVPEVLRYGSHSQASDYVSDRPTQIGFRRVGPDLAREGGKQTSLWHWQHLENPQNKVPESVMPAFDHVLQHPLTAGENLEMMRQAESIAADIVGQGGPVIYGNDLLMNSRGIALIAYLQRLGVVTPPMNK